MRGSKFILLLELLDNYACKAWTIMVPVSVCMFKFMCVCVGKLIVNTHSYCRVTHVCNLPSTYKYAMKNISH